MRRARTTAKGAGALALLLALLAGVPLLLVQVAGWPLPTSVPTFDQLGEGLTGGRLPDQLLVKAIAVVVWLAWAQLAVGVVAEVVGLVRRRAVRRVPAAATFRHLASSLVATSMTLVAAVGAVRPVGAAVASPPVLVSVAAPVVAPTAPGAEASTPRRADLDEVWVVRRRDTLWGIAEATLGDGARWREVARVNEGREVAPGQQFDAAVLRTGWRLVLPPGAHRRGGDVPAATSGASAPAPVESPVLGEARMVVRVAPGDTLVGIARRVYGDGSQWRRIWEANRGRTFDGRSFTDANLIRVGWALDVPLPSTPTGLATQAVPPVDAPVDAQVGAQVDVRVDAQVETQHVSNSPVASLFPPEPASTIEPAPPSSAPAATDAAGLPAAGSSAGAGRPSTVRSNAPRPPSAAPAAGFTPSPAAPSEGRGPDATAPVSTAGASSPWALVTGLAGATLLATGLTSMVASRRRRRLERMAGDEVLPTPDPDLVPAERAARLGADPLAAARVDVALRALARGGRAVRPVAVRRLASGDLDVVLAEPAPPVAPWLSDHDDRIWYLPASVPLAALAAAGAGVPAPCPALVLLGVGAGAELYVDLEAVGTLVLAGPPGAAAAIARAVVASLAVSPLAEHVQVIAAGIDCYGFANEERVHAVADGDAALELATTHAFPVQRALGLAGASSTFALRADRPAELWEPAVVVAVGEPTTRADAESLDRLAGAGGRGVALLTDVELASAAWRLVLDGDGWRLDPLGHRVQAIGLAADELADAGALLHDALAAPSAAPARPAAPMTDAPFVEPRWSILVRLLGAVDVVDRHGAPAAFERAKACELVAWLSQHRLHPTRSGARTALWDANVRDATFANVVSDARRSLARLVEPPDGEEWIARTYVDDLPLHELVLTDADLLAARLTHARRQPDLAAIATLRPGLDLVRDLPYAGSHYLWPDGEALPSHLCLLVIAAAVELATRCLATGDPDGAFWATAQGMKVLAAHDELVCLRLRAHALHGNLAGVRAEYEGYERAITADPWGDGAPSAKVVQLRNDLLRSPVTVR